MFRKVIVDVHGPLGGATAEPLFTSEAFMRVGEHQFNAPIVYFNRHEMAVLSVELDGKYLPQCDGYAFGLGENCTPGTPLDEWDAEVYLPMFFKLADGSTIRLWSPRWSFKVRKSA